MIETVEHRILFIRFGGIGDILMTTPTLRAVKARYPLAQIDYLVSRGFRDVLHGHPCLRTIYEFQKRGLDLLPHRLIPFLRTLRRECYDLVVNLQPSVKTNLIARAAAPARTLTFSKDQAVQEATRQRRHAVNDFYETIRPLGVDDLADRDLDFFVPPVSRDVVGRLLIERNCSAGMRLIVVHPSANHRVNRWPIAHHVALCDELARQEGTFLVLSGHRRDKRLTRSIREAMQVPSRCTDLSGVLSLKELGALLERADLFITGDTGPMHLASAVGVPMVSLFGAADPNRTKALARTSRVVSERSLACVPCHARTCRFGREARCMKMLLPRTVLDVIDDSMKHSWQTARLQMEPVNP